MDLMTGLALAVVLCIALWVPYFIHQHPPG